MNQYQSSPLLLYHQKGEIKTMTTTKTNVISKIISNRKGEITVTNDSNN